MTRHAGRASEAIPYGASVLLRGNEVRLASRSIANGIARPVTFFPNSGGAYLLGEWVTVDLIEGLGERDLKALAAGPIMDPLRINLPAGKLSERDYQARLDLQFSAAGLQRNR